MMTSTLLAVTAATLIAAIGLALVFRRLARSNDVSREYWADVSLAKYRPMERLLSGEDFEFLARQPGYEPRLARKLRAERRDIVRHYLRLMAKDFRRVYAAAQSALLHSTEDRPDLAAQLLRLRLEFLFAGIVLRCRLAFHPLGLPSLDLRPVMGTLERLGEMARQISCGQLTPGSVAA